MRISHVQFLCHLQQKGNFSSYRPKANTQMIDIHAEFYVKSKLQYALKLRNLNSNFKT